MSNNINNEEVMQSQVEEQMDEAAEVAPVAETVDAVESAEQTELTALKHQRSLLNGDNNRGPKAKPGRFVSRPSNTVLGISGRERIESQDSAERARAQIELYQSYLNKRILTGKVIGVRAEYLRRGDNNGMMWYVITTNGPYQVKIPAEQFSDVTAEQLLATYKRTDPNKTLDDAYNIYLKSRIGAEIDYVVSAMPEEGTLDEVGWIGGNRAEAMYRNRVRFWFAKTTDGQDHIKVGDRAQARVIAVAGSGIRVEIFGVEAFITARELAWNMITDCRSAFSVGSKVLVVITDIKRDAEDDYKVSFEASVRQALPDPRIRGMELFQDGGVYSGVINFIRVPTEDAPKIMPAVFVKLDGCDGVQCMCRFPLGSVPPKVGARVIVRITNHIEEKRAIYGLIQHINQTDE